MRKVNQQEIERLYQFTRQHYVEYYDLQTELVDHLATGIEENWKENPELDFEKNLQKEFSKFGVFGFMETIESHQKVMNKKYWKILWRESFQSLIKPRTFLSFILIFGLCYSLSLNEIGFEILRIGFFILAIVGIIFMFKQNKKMNNKKKENQKIYLLEAMITQSQSNGIILFLPFQIMLINHSDNLGNLQAILISLIISLTFLLFYITNNILPSKKDDIL